MLWGHRGHGIYHNIVRDVPDMRPFLLWKTLTRLNSFGNGLLLLELSSLTPGGPLRAAGRNQGRNGILFKGKVVSTNKKKAE
jgi:hypothetical protein